MSEPFLAEIRIFACNFAPRDWAACDGQLLPIAQNTALFSIIGTTYGGDGRTTTALPDLRGAFPMHPGQGPGLSWRTLGQRGGAETVSLTEAQAPAHSHTVGAAGSPVGVPVKCTSGMPNHGYEGGYLARALDAPRYVAAAPNVALRADSVDLRAATAGTGGGQPHNNLPPCLAVNFMVALQGLYPSRS